VNNRTKNAQILRKDETTNILKISWKKIEENGHRKASIFKLASSYTFGIR